MKTQSQIASKTLLANDLDYYWAQRAGWGQQTVALVPTMGALHEGHLSLVRLAKSQADKVVVSIFVNPLQFGPNEDFSRYPKTMPADLAACQAAGVDLVYAPEIAEIYPNGMAEMTQVLPPASLTNCFCGTDRPGHFTGVATVVYKLFQGLKPTLAVFGEKDAQQLAVIERMVADLALPVHILPHPIVRQESGLAMSSRNVYIHKPDEREAALALSKVLFLIQSIIKDNATAAYPAQPTLNRCLENVLDTLSLNVRRRFQLEYLDAVCPRAFDRQEHLAAGQRVLIAAKILLDNASTVRLIDNILL